MAGSQRKPRAARLAGHKGAAAPGNRRQQRLQFLCFEMVQKKVGNDQVPQGFFRPRRCAFAFLLAGPVKHVYGVGRGCPADGRIARPCFCIQQIDTVQKRQLHAGPARLQGAGNAQHQGCVACAQLQ